MLVTASVAPAMVFERKVTLPEEGRAQDVAGLGRVVNIGCGVYAGPLPDDFSKLKAVGFNYVICVDSVRPESGEVPVTFRPTPYSGLSSDVRSLELPDAGQVYVFCHHGRHRGPAAAVWLARRRGLSAAAGRSRLTIAGTGAEYAGLWQDALGSTDVVEPPAESDGPSLLRRSMAEADHAFDADNLTSDRRTLLSQAFREAARDADVSQALREELLEAADEAKSADVRAVRERCTDCHQRYRG